MVECEQLGGMVERQRVTKKEVFKIFLLENQSLFILLI